MEGIIMMVVLFIISSILSGARKKQQKQEPMPPFSNQSTRPPEKRKSLEDFASEVIQQLSDKTQPTKATQPLDQQRASKRVNESTGKEISKKIIPKARQALDDNRSSGRGSTISSKFSTSDMIEQKEIGSFVPTTRNALVQAIITTEILGPPKAKQSSKQTFKN